MYVSDQYCKTNASALDGARQSNRRKNIRIGTLKIKIPLKKLENFRKKLTIFPIFFLFSKIDFQITSLLSLTLSLSSTKKHHDATN